MFNFNDYARDFKSGNMNPYDVLSKSCQKGFREREFCDMLTGCLVSMFEYEKDETYKNIDDRTIELTMILNGLNGFCRDDNGKVVCGFAYDGGRLDANGIGETVSINLINGKGFHGVRGINDIVVGLNNSTRSADFGLFRYADILSNVCLSEENNIDFTRINPIYVAKNNKIKTLIQTALSKLKRGEPMIISDNTISLNQDEIIKQTAITDNVAIDKLQYLTTYYNQVLRRFFTTYGMSLADGMKQAQESVAEISSSDAMAFILPLDRLKQRQKMCERLVETFGGSISVKFSKAWETQFEKINSNSLVDETKGVEQYGIDKN